MQTMVWSDLLELGHDRIDAEHRQLLDLACEIVAIGDQGGEVGTLRPYYQEFHRLLLVHCAYEEGLLRSLPRSAFGAQVDAHCQGHSRLIALAKSVAAGALPDGYDSPQGFITAYVHLMHDLLVDDAELIGALIREGRFTPTHPAHRAHPVPPAAGRLPPI